MIFFQFWHRDKPLENHCFNRCGMFDQIFILHSFCSSSKEIILFVIVDESPHVQISQNPAVSALSPESGQVFNCCSLF